MRRGLLALLVLLGSSPVALAQFHVVTTPGTTRVTPRVGPDEVVARIMTFDQNSDGRVAIGELSERMRPLVDRGDKNGDGALDRSEIVALSRAPSTQAGRAVFLNSGYSFGEDVGFSSRQHIEGALEDLRLTADKAERALPRVRAYIEQVETAARADLLDRMEHLLSPEQFVAFARVFDNQPRELTIRTNVNGARAPQVLRMTSTANLIRRVDGMGLALLANEQARKALEEYMSRTRFDRETDRAELLAQVTGVLSAEELVDFQAAMARKPVVANGRGMLNNVAISKANN